MTFAVFLSLAFSRKLVKDTTLSHVDSMFERDEYLALAWANHMQDLVFSCFLC